MKTTEARYELRTWRFMIDQDAYGLAAGWEKASYDHSLWKEVEAYTSWQTYDDALYDYEGGGWFYTTFHTKDSENRRYVLHFDGVGGTADVYVNGRFAFHNVSRFLPFDVDATPFAVPGQENSVAVFVDNTNIAGREHLTGRPRTEWVMFGGLTHHVYVEERELCRIAHVEVKTHHDGTARVRVKVENSSGADFSGTLATETAELPETAAQQEITVRAGGVGFFDFTTKANSVTPWSPDTPKLYTLTASLTAQGRTVHTVTERIGYRTIAVEGTKILLNGQEILLKGANRYDEYAPYGICPPAELIREDLLEMKRCGMNIVRTHYQQDPIHYEIADEIGLFYILEVPLNWWRPTEEETLADYPALEAEAVDNLYRTYENYCNHPCWIVWSTSNECPHSRPACQQMFRMLARRMRELDCGRLITTSLFYPIMDEKELDYNDFIGLNLYCGAACKSVSEFDEQVVAATRAKMETAIRFYPDRPLVLTEFGVCSICGLHGSIEGGRFSEEFAANYLRTVCRVYTEYPAMKGMIIWSWADHRYRHEEMRYALTSMHTNSAYGPFGLKTDDRRTKTAVFDAMKDILAGFRL